MKKLPETLTEEEFAAIMKQTKNKHHKVAFGLGFYQGMRISEIVNLLPENIDKGQKIIRIKQGKGSKDRNIPIAPEMFRNLSEIPIGCGARALEIAFKKSVAKAGITKDLHFHNLRHSCATRLLGVKKWNIRQVQVFLGHSKLDTTMIYTVVGVDDLKEAMWG